MAREKITIFEGMAILKKFLNKATEAGCTFEDFQRLLDKEGDPAIEKFVKATLELRPKIYKSFKYDKTQDGWKLLEDVPFDGQPFTPDIVEFLKPNKSSVNGEEMKQRAKQLNAHLGQRHAEYLLDHQDLIPKEWRGKYYLTFPGTVW